MPFKMTSAYITCEGVNALESTEIKDDMTKSAFDGRLHYFKIWQGIVTNIIMAKSEYNFDLWLNIMEDYYFITSGYMKPTQSAELESLFNKCHNYNDTIQRNPRALIARYMIISLRTKLRGIQKKLFDYTKHLMLPVKSDEDDEFDAIGWAKQSDL